MRDVLAYFTWFTVFILVVILLALFAYWRACSPSRTIDKYLQREKDEDDDY